MYNLNLFDTFLLPLLLDLLTVANFISQHWKLVFKQLVMSVHAQASCFKVALTHFHY